ncbi:MAG: alpha/beta hydrolase [Actinomycetota bacterium]|nr:alpha/beta hydrolase [Actinomycetota bacterium]
MSLRSFIWGVFWTLVALTLVFHVAGGWYFSGELIEDGFEIAADELVLVSGDYELQEVAYTSPLGEMAAWYLPADGTTWVIHVHGKGATPAEAEPLFTPLQDAGYPQLAITYRNDDGQPQDPSGYYQYGVTEWEDVAGAVEYAVGNGAESIVLNGYSTGGAHVLSYMYRQSLSTVSGVMLDSPNIDLSETVDFGASQRELPLLPFNVPESLSAVAQFFTSLRIGVNWKSVDYAERAAVSLRQPVLVHHGTADLTVPVSESVELAEAKPDLVQLILVEGAGHVGSYEVDPDKYIAEVLGFLQEVG